MKNSRLQPWSVNGVNRIRASSVAFIWTSCFTSDPHITMICSAAKNPIFPAVEKEVQRNLLQSTVKTMQRQMAGVFLICIPSGNHDMDRLARTLDPEEMKIAFAFLLSMPGAPFIYYGDEIGMRYVENLTSVEGGYNRTGSRSPMQWNTSANAGFSSAPSEKLYVPVDPDRNRPNAEKEMADDTSLYSEVKRLIAFRMAHPALQSMAAIHFLSDGDPLIYERTCDKERILVIIHPADRNVVVPDVKGEILYTVGGNASVTEDGIAVDGGTAVFLAL